MPRFSTQHRRKQLFWYTNGFSLLLVAVLFYYQWVIGILALLGFIVLLYLTHTTEKAFTHELKRYTVTLTHRVKKAGKGAISDLPIGMLLYNDDRVIEWHNPFVGRMLNLDSAVGEKMSDVLPFVKEQEDAVVEWQGRWFEVSWKQDDRLVYLTENTEFKLLEQRHQDEKLVMGLLVLDNLDEITRGMDEQKRSVMQAKVVSVLTDWARSRNILLSRVASDRFMLVMRQQDLEKLEEDKFSILDIVRDETKEYIVPLTLSIGVGAGVDDLVELRALTQASLDIVLGRGGDQAAVRSGDRLSFYGGRSNAMEKRTRVRARVISHALRELMKESDKVIIMGHKSPDMDSIGAAIGIWKAAQVCNKDAYIVLEGVNPSIERLMAEIRNHSQLNSAFVTPDDAMELAHPRTLAVVVDTHKASMVAEPRLLQRMNRIFVADHHRRGEEFIDQATLVYIEPYASSTCELVTELLQYIQDRITMNVIEATAILAGIVVDTKSFSQRTGARTFEAASFLRRHGADSTLVQLMLKENLDAYIEKAEIIKHTEVIDDHIAIAVAKTGRAHPQLLIAQVADTLLNMVHIKASFVISERMDGKISISARSVEPINVQIIMERLGGGGHYSNAAVQLETTLGEAEQQLKRVLKEIKQEEGLNE